MRSIHFIVNPISGKGKHLIDKAFLLQHFPEGQYEITVHQTGHKKHAIALATAAKAENPYCIVACGGDGTINEVACCLVNTTIHLGIIPVGSGNGLASNLKIPKDIEAAVRALKNGLTAKIDVGMLNGRYFFSNMGIGIDAMVIKKYEASGKRTLPAYVKAALASSTEYTAYPAKIRFGRQTVEMVPLLLFVSNSNEMGYNLSLTPKASLCDGFLDLLLVPELNFMEKMQLGLAVLGKKIHSFKKAQHALIEELEMEMPEKIFLDAQIDGEYHNLKTNAIKVGMVRNGLSVIVPQ